MTLNNAASTKAPERVIVDQGGVSWRVTEVRVWDASGRGATSLIAAHERGFRRLWHFPAEWAALADGELAELVSKPVRKGRPEPAAVDASRPVEAVESVEAVAAVEPVETLEPVEAAEAAEPVASVETAKE